MGRGAPGQPGAYGPYPPGGPYGPGGWAPPPPAPQPGVVPLRPLDVGDILKGVFSTLGRYWKPLFGSALVAHLVAVLVTGGALVAAYLSYEDLLNAFWDGVRAGGTGLPDPAALGPVMLAFAGVWLVGMLAMAAAGAFVAAACPAVLQDAAIGRPARVGAVLRRAASALLPVLAWALLGGVITIVPTALLVTGFYAVLLGMLTRFGGPDLLDLPGWLGPLMMLAGVALLPLAVWLWVRISLVPAVVVLEAQGLVGALRRSALLVRGSWWRIFGILLLGAVLAAVASAVLQLPFSWAAAVPEPSFGTDPEASMPSLGGVLTLMATSMAFSMVGQLVAQTVTAAFPPLVASLLYVDQRIRTENLAASLAEAAGMPRPAPAAAPPTVTE
ncbi:hypothetical protein GCM10023237_52330 [Streptomyces coeruleoprunus]